MLRRVVLGWPLRRKNLRIRNQRKRERTKDRFAPSNTKEPPVHSWFNAHMSKVLLQEYQRVRNLNRFTIPYDEQLRKEFVTAAENYSLFKLHQYYGEYERLQDLNTVMDAAAEQAETLPGYLRDEVLNMGKHNSKYDRCDETSPFYRYYEQMLKIYPKALATNITAARRIAEISDDVLKFHES